MKIRSLFLMVLLLLFLVSCEKTPNMSELLQYEKESVRFRLHITDKTEFSAEFVTGAESDTLTFLEDSLSGTHIVFQKDGGVEVKYEDYKIPLPSVSLLKAIRWKALFHLSEKNLLWKIQKETLGGLTVYCCQADDVTIYIDAATYLPLKMVQGDLVIDIAESETISEKQPRG